MTTTQPPLTRRYAMPAAVLVGALAVLLLLSLIRPSATVLGHSPGFDAVVETTAIIIAFGAAYFALTEFFYYGSVATLLVGLSFLLLSYGNAGVGLLPFLAGWHGPVGWDQLLLGAERVVSGALLVIAGTQGTNASRSSGRSQLLMVSVGIVLAVSTFATAAAYFAAPHLHTSVPLELERAATGVLYLAAAALFWMNGARAERPWFIWLSLNFCVGGFSQLVYTDHTVSGSTVQISDLLRLTFFAGILLGLIAEWGRGYRTLRVQASELEVLHSLMTAPNLQNTDEVVRHIARVVGDALNASIEVVVAPQSTGEDDGVLGSPPALNDLVPRESMRVTMQARGRSLGTLTATRPNESPFTVGEQRLLRTFATQAASLVDRSLLYEEMAVGAILEERSRLAREIHDGLAQHLAFLKMRIAWLKRAPSAVGPGQLQDIEGMLTTALAEARQAISTLRTGSLTATATEAVESYAAEFSQLSGLKVVTECRDDVPDVGPRSRVELLRIVQEALNNVRKHASATAVWIVLENDDGGLRVQIVDDGEGFVIEDDGDGHFGTEIMRERAESVGGSLVIQSSPGQGTRVSLWVPAGEEQAYLDQVKS